MKIDKYLQELYEYVESKKDNNDINYFLKTSLRHSDKPPAKIVTVTDKDARFVSRIDPLRIVADELDVTPKWKTIKPLTADNFFGYYSNLLRPFNRTDQQLVLHINDFNAERMVIDAGNYRGMVPFLSNDDTNYRKVIAGILKADYTDEVYNSYKVAAKDYLIDKFNKNKVEINNLLPKADWGGTTILKNKLVEYHVDTCAEIEELQSPSYGKSM